MAGPIRISILANAAPARRELNSTGSAAEGLGSKFSSAAKKVGKFAAVGLAVAGAAAVKFGIDAVQAASDAQQSLGATETVFGKFADKVIRSSERAAEKYGLSANTYRENANLIGSLFKGQGVSVDKLAGKTDKMIGTAADLAATFGGTTSDAVEALGSAFKGEFDPLERYGVSLKQSDINARLAAKGQDKLTGQGLKLAKQTAATDLIMQQAKQTHGAFAKESDTLAHQQQVLTAKFDDAKAKIGTALLPILTDLTSWVTDHVIPVLEDFGGWLETNQGQIEDAANSVGDTLLPVLKDLGDLASKVAGFLGGLPGPVKKIGVEVGVAALIFPRLTSAIAATRTGLTTLGTTMGTTATRMAALKRAAGAAAGVGGMVLLADGAQRADTKIGLLETTAGGAALGFSVGGPWGAAIGAGAGALYGLQAAADASNQAFKRGLQFNEDYIGSLDQVTGAVTRATKATLFKNFTQDDTFTVSRMYGIPDRDVINAALGNVAAMERIKARLNRAIKNGTLDPSFKSDFLNSLRQDHKEIEAGDRAIDRRTRALQTWRQALHGIPKKVRTELKQEGYAPNLKQLQTLTKKYNLTPKQIKTIIKATGVDLTVKQVLGVHKALKDTDKIKPNLGVWESTFLTGLSKTQRDVYAKTGDINQALKAGTGRGRADLGPFQTSVVSGVTSAQGPARSGGVGVGAALKAGVIAGFAGTQTALANAAAAAVNAAVAAAHNAAESHSPSRKTMKVGEDLGAGLLLGLRQSVVRGLDGVRSALETVTGAIDKTVQQQLAATEARLRKRFKGKELARHIRAAEKASRLHHQAVMRDLKDEYAALVANGRAQDKNAAALAKARDNLRSLTQAATDYAAGVRASFVESANITNLGKTEDGTVTTKNLLDDLKDKLVAAQRFASLIRTLSKGGLNKTTLQQLLAAGPEAGLATAEAIAAGGKSAVTEINSLTTQIAKQGTSLGQTMKAKFYGVGIRAAQGLVDGLEKEKRRLDRVATRLANTLVDKVKQALGIHSPSKVFRDLGKQTVHGLRIGLDETYVKRSGARLATSLEQGFGTPALTAFASTSGSRTGATSVQITVNVPPGADKVAIGREVQSALDAYYAAGGRRA